MLIKTIPVGHIETNCYIVTDEDTRRCAVIDPGDESNSILDYVEEQKLQVEQIMITHGHFDHTLAARAVQLETGAPIWIHAGDLQDGMPSRYRFDPAGCTVNTWTEGTEVSAGGLTFTVIETPGHSPGGVTLRCGQALFTGDTLFRDSCGRTDLDGGNMDVLLGSLRRLADLPGDFEVYPGHMDATTLERERRFNYYLRYAAENS